MLDYYYSFNVVLQSFLDILAARKDPSGLSGEVLIDGAPQPPNFKCLSGYVVQVHFYVKLLFTKQTSLID